MSESSNVLQFPESEILVCLNCGKPVRTVLEDETFLHGVEPAQVQLSVRVPVRWCDACGLSYSDDEAEDVRHEAVCRHLGVMTPREVRNVRERHGLNRAEFSRLTGLGEASLQRWEAGSLIQNTANDRFLLLLTNPRNLELLKQRSLKVETGSTPNAEDGGRVVAIAGSGRQFRALRSAGTLDQVARQGRGFRTLS